MRVFELIAELQKMDQNLDVIDCEMENVDIVKTCTFSYYRGRTDVTVVVLG